MSIKIILSTWNNALCRTTPFWNLYSSISQFHIICFLNIRLITDLYSRSPSVILKAIWLVPIHYFTANQIIVFFLNRKEFHVNITGYEPVAFTHALSTMNAISVNLFIEEFEWCYVAMETTEYRTPTEQLWKKPKTACELTHAWWVEVSEHDQRLVTTDDILNVIC